MEQGVSGVDRPTLTGSNVVSGIEAGSTDIPHRTRLVPFSVELIPCSQSITVILDEPEPMLFTKGCHR